MSEFHLPHDHHHEKHHEDALSRLAIIDDFNLTAEVFKMLGDGSRLRIFWLLCHCEDCVINISAMVNMSRPVDLSPAAEMAKRCFIKQQIPKEADFFIV